MANLEDFCYCGHHRTEHYEGSQHCWYEKANAEGDDVIECSCCSFLSKQKCPNLKEHSGKWEDLLIDEIALFAPLKGYKCKKECPICSGTGIVPLIICADCYGTGGVGTDMGDIEICNMCNGKGYKS
jgi:hypothetical protein